MSADQWADDYRPCAGDSPFTLVVEGEIFTVRLRPDGGQDYTWESGPNEEYGFGGGPARAAGAPDPEPYRLTIGEHRESISGFLGMIDTETGYIE
ncbi:hypothetical protein ACFC06_18465 [Nocardia sp. NPDC056064]|uniref:hypothetical protein n=1 Tax=Nocardia sp. NPDC056064 TaxID=3345701 RepID=UPI0035DF5182